MLDKIKWLFFSIISILPVHLDFMTKCTLKPLSPRGYTRVALNLDKEIIIGCNAFEKKFLKIKLRDQFTEFQSKKEICLML